MNQYRHARLTIERILHYYTDKSDSVGRIELSCTEPVTVEWFKTEMQYGYSFLPSFSKDEVLHTQSGEMYSCLIRFEEDRKNVSAIAQEISSGLLRMLCEPEWELYSSKTYLKRVGENKLLIGDVYYLKSEYAKGMAPIYHEWESDVADKLSELNDLESYFRRRRKVHLTSDVSEKPAEHYDLGFDDFDNADEDEYD